MLSSTANKKSLAFIADFEKTFDVEVVLHDRKDLSKLNLVGRGKLIFEDISGWVTEENGRIINIVKENLEQPQIIKNTLFHEMGHLAGFTENHYFFDELCSELFAYFMGAVDCKCIMEAVACVEEYVNHAFTEKEITLCSHLAEFKANSIKQTSKNAHTSCFRNTLIAKPAVLQYLRIDEVMDIVRKITDSDPAVISKLEIELELLRLKKMSERSTI